MGTKITPAEITSVMPGSTVNRVRLLDGRSVLWGSREHVTALRALWAEITPDARRSVRNAADTLPGFRGALTLIDACPTCEYVGGTHVSWCPTYAAR